MRPKILFIRHAWKKFPSLMLSRKQSTFNPETQVWPVTCTFSPDCVFDRMKDIESKWSSYVKNKPVSSQTKPKKYILAMFPYPSGSLHLGHVLIYSSAAVISRYYALLGYDVVNPIGWDSFGLPAENAALERDLSPLDWTSCNIVEMRRQLTSLDVVGQEREASHEASFYRWTQFILKELLKHKLLYKSRSLVNWDPIDKTVLADDQVDDNGKSWRSGSLVEKRLLTQWFIKTSRFVEDLYHGQGVNQDSRGVNLAQVLKVQQKWIGEPSGRVYYIPVGETANYEFIPVFTSSPELFMQTEVKLLVSKDHWLVSSGNVTCVRNPFTGRDMPLVTASQEQEADLIPSNFKATLFCDSKEVRDVTQDSETVSRKCKEDTSLGGYLTSSKFSDWLISRQRYWGCPLPIIACSVCGPVAVEDLPVELPPVKDFRKLKDKTNRSDEVTSKLAELAPQEWLSVSCPSCGSTARRESETCDTFVDSSWYYLRYATDPCNEKPFDPDFWATNRVDVYLGGPEHMQGHLLTSRMMFHFLTKYAYLESPFTEPYNAFVLQGIITAKTFKDRHSHRYLTPEEAAKLPKGQVVVQYEKMSKSKGNGVNPDDLVFNFGGEATKMTVIGDSTSSHQSNWRGSDKEFTPTTKFLRKAMLAMDLFIYARQLEQEAYPLVKRFSLKANSEMKKPINLEQEFKKLKDLRNETIVKVMLHFGHDFKLGRGIKMLQEFLYGLIRNILVKEICRDLEFERCLGDWIVMMSVLTPCLSQEMWSAFRLFADKNPLRNRFDFSKERVDQQSFPKIDDDHIIPVKIRVDDEVYEVPVERLVIDRCNEKEILDIALRFCQDNQSLSDLQVDWRACSKKTFLVPGLKAVVKFVTGIKKDIKKKKKIDQDSDDEEDTLIV